MKRTASICMAFLLFLSGCGQSGEASGSSEEVVAKENQELIYGQIETIAGNELTLAVAEAKESGGSAQTDSSKQQNAEQENIKQQNAEQQNQELQVQMLSSETDMQGGTPPGGDGEMPGGGDMPGGGSMPSFGEEFQDGQQEAAGGEESDSGENKKNTSGNRISYTLTGETQEMRIPVGTPVITSLGTTTSFSRLAAGDMLKMLTQTDEDGNQVIVGVWIVG